MQEIDWKRKCLELEERLAQLRADHLQIEVMVLPVQIREYLRDLLEKEQVREREALSPDCVYAQLRSSHALGAVMGAAVITLPGLYEYVDAEGYRFQAVGWSRLHAKLQIERDGRHRGELHWMGSSAAWPGMGVSNQGKMDPSDWDGGPEDGG